ncbi:MAG: serine hydrolase [Rhodobacteraceae bacterium]|nr:serine hydrolase [Paracoccaceae bacterium]
MEALLKSALKSGLFYGAEMLVARRKKQLFHAAVGTYDGTRPLTKNAVFDVASLTKPVVTARLLCALGLPLDSKVSAYIPHFSGGGKEAITLRHLAAHLSGLPPTVRFIETCTTPEETFEALLNVPLKTPPEQTVAYSCLGYMLLGKVLEAHTGQSLQSLFAEHIAKPSGMLESGFLPLQNGIAPSRIVPSGRRSPGVVYDSNAWLMGGISGNAGLFSTARDLHRFALWLLKNPMLEMLTSQPRAVGRAIGFELQTPAHPASCGAAFPAGAIGHTGFTGTSLWLDPKSELIAVILTNRAAVSHRGNMAEMARFRRQAHALTFSIFGS